MVVEATRTVHHEVVHLTNVVDGGDEHTLAVGTETVKHGQERHLAVDTPRVVDDEVLLELVHDDEKRLRHAVDQADDIVERVSLLQDDHSDTPRKGFVDSDTDEQGLAHATVAGQKDASVQRTTVESLESFIDTSLNSAVNMLRHGQVHVGDDFKLGPRHRYDFDFVHVGFKNVRNLSEVSDGTNGRTVLHIVHCR